MTKTLEKHFGRVDRDFENIKGLHIEDRYSLMSEAASKLPIKAYRWAILDVLGEGEVVGGQKMAELRAFVGEPGVASFYKILNLLEHWDPNGREVVIDYVMTQLQPSVDEGSALLIREDLSFNPVEFRNERGWGAEYDKDRIFPRYYVERIVKGEEVPLYVFQLSRVIDVSYLATDEKKVFLANLLKYPDLDERLRYIVDFNIGLFNNEPIGGFQSVHEEIDLDSLMKILENLVSVRNLNISGISTQVKLRELIEKCPNKDGIEMLNVSYSISFDEFVEIGSLGLKGLKDLFARGLNSAHMNDDNCAFIKKLRVLDISSSCIDSDESVWFDLLSKCLEMEELILQDVEFYFRHEPDKPSITLEMPKLRLLDMSQASNISAWKVEVLRVNLPLLEDFRASVCRFDFPSLATRFEWNTPNLKHLRFTKHEVGFNFPGFLEKYLKNLVSLDIGSLTLSFDQTVSLLELLDPKKIRALALPDLADFGDENDISIWDNLLSKFTELESLSVPYSIKGLLQPDSDGRVRITELPDGLSELKLGFEHPQRDVDRMSLLHGTNLRYLSFCCSLNEVVDCGIVLPKELKVLGSSLMSPILNFPGLVYFDSNSRYLLSPMTLKVHAARSKTQLLGVSLGEVEVGCLPIFHSTLPNLQYAKYYEPTSSILAVKERFYI